MTVQQKEVAELNKMLPFGGQYALTAELLTNGLIRIEDHNTKYAAVYDPETGVKRSGQLGFMDINAALRAR